MNPSLTCSSLPHPLHRSAIRSPHRQSHRRPIWAIYAVLKPSKIEHSHYDQTLGEFILFTNTSFWLITLSVIRLIIWPGASGKVFIAFTFLSGGLVTLL